ncbi:hypothetical protein AGDE_12895 [Angomonas deanei]|nr:hypothetical protein AGDE_12895 [Angomonas deanei]|eukprot:EPY23321.1 hypothetical protein AGDE_12895 [Angomonas deanei]
MDLPPLPPPPVTAPHSHPMLSVLCGMMDPTDRENSTLSLLVRLLDTNEDGEVAPPLSTSEMPAPEHAVVEKKEELVFPTSLDLLVHCGGSPTAMPCLSMLTNLLASPFEESTDHHQHEPKPEVHETPEVVAPEVVAPVDRRKSSLALASMIPTPVVPGANDWGGICVVLTAPPEGVSPPLAPPLPAVYPAQDEPKEAEEEEESSAAEPSSAEPESPPKRVQRSNVGGRMPQMSAGATMGNIRYQSSYSRKPRPLSQTALVGKREPYAERFMKNLYSRTSSPAAAASRRRSSTFRGLNPPARPLPSAGSQKAPRTPQRSPQRSPSLGEAHRSSASGSTVPSNFAIVGQKIALPSVYSPLYNTRPRFY